MVPVDRNFFIFFFIFSLSFLVKFKKQVNRSIYPTRDSGPAIEPQAY